MSGKPDSPSKDIRAIRSFLRNMELSDSQGCSATGDDSKKLSFTYNVERVLGSGSFGIVYQLQVVETGKSVAIKRVYQDKRHQSRELQIMKELRHPNGVEFKHVFYTSGDQPGETCLNLVMEYCSHTVYGVMKHYEKTKQALPQIFVQLYSYQICRGCAYIHALGICHRDIKPQNLLVDGKTHALKLCDFGSAKRLVKGESSVAYIGSRYYRAPELILGATDYTTAIDLWSAACVTAELVLGEPIFPGESNVDQLLGIVEVLGTPTRDELMAMGPKLAAMKWPQIKPYPWSKVFRPRTSSDTITIDYISKLLVYDPRTRPSGLQSCMHPLFDDIRDPAARISNSKALPDNLFVFSQEEQSLMDAETTAKLVPSWFTEGQQQPMRAQASCGRGGD
jgi:glycogen synthase kinase 3 beta